MLSNSGQGLGDLTRMRYGVKPFLRIGDLVKRGEGETAKKRRAVFN